MPERATVPNRSEKSAEAVVVGATRRRAQREGQSRGMSLGGVVHQKPAAAGRAGWARDEAARAAERDETPLARRAQTDCGAGGLLAQVLARENVVAAWKRVKANKGSAGVDGRTVRDTAEYLKGAWPDIRRELFAGTYLPAPVRRGQIPKPGGGMRELGIPTVVDRLILQALLQVLQPLIDPTFSEHSHGFRPGRSAHGAVLTAQQHVQAGYRVIVDVDLEKFFDRVNHDILMDRLAKRIGDAQVLRLIRRYLQAGIMAHGVVQERFEGTPQGGPLSPLLANVLLDEVDRRLERCGHRFVRYADDCNVYVRSHKAGERVLRQLKRCYAKLRLKVNESKTAVAAVRGRKFLGYCLYVTGRGEVKRAVSDEAMDKLRDRLRGLAGRSRGRSLEQVAVDLRGDVPGWKAYFRLAQTPRVFADLDEWLRHRLRAVRLKQWRRRTTVFRELRALGASVDLAARIAGNARRWYRNSRFGLNRILPVAYFDRLGVPKFS